MTEPELSGQTPYERLGQSGVHELVNEFYDVMETAPEASAIRAMHAEDLTPMRQMLKAYLTTWMGGPPVYIALKGSMCLTDVHAPFHIGPAARDQWLFCMKEALSRIGADESLIQLLEIPFRQVAETVQNQVVDESQLIAKG